MDCPAAESAFAAGLPLRVLGLFSTIGLGLGGGLLTIYAGEYVLGAVVMLGLSVVWLMRGRPRRPAPERAWPRSRSASPLEPSWFETVLRTSSP